MCGIIAMLSKNNITKDIIDCLERLQNRGYDSAGIAYFVNDFTENDECSKKMQNTAK